LLLSLLLVAMVLLLDVVAHRRWTHDVPEQGVAAFGP
jgi:hypothetical protein